MLSEHISTSWSWFYGLTVPAHPTDDTLLYDIVTYRKGDSQRDKKAYSSAKKDRWIFFHDVFYAPDILLRRSPGESNDILPIEVKLITAKSPSQSVASALGQSIVYSNKYPNVIVFLGVMSSVDWGKYKFRVSKNQKEQNLYNFLEDKGIKVILREVGLPNTHKVHSTDPI